jgi:hypothetical protein
MSALSTPQVIAQGSEDASRPLEPPAAYWGLYDRLGHAVVIDVINMLNPEPPSRAITRRC